MEEMSQDELLVLVENSRVGHLALAKDGKAYALPLFYGHDGRAFYFHAHPGLKDEFINATEEACFVITRVETLEDWASAMIFGRLDRVTDDDERLAAMDALMSAPLPPEFGFSETGEPARSDTNVEIVRLTPLRMSGRKSRSAGPSVEEQEIGIGGM